MRSPSFENTPLALEEVTRRRDDAGERCELSLQLPVDWEYTRGHFPGYPIVPGVAQLVAMVERPARTLWPELGAPRSVARLKFRRPITPGERVRVVLERAGEQVRFSLAVGEAPCAAGIMRFSEAAGPS
ncbi:MAG: hypothetical protein R3A51_05415 [Nannocystaceae bacterium]|nr:hypothetical protein [Myxococcales bacterium]